MSTNNNNTTTSLPSADIGRRKRLGESSSAGSNSLEGSELAPTIEEFQRWCSKLKSSEELSIFQTFCNDYLDKLIQEKEGEAKELDKEFEIEQQGSEEEEEEGSSGDDDEEAQAENQPKQSTQEIIKSNLKVLQNIKQSIRDKIPNDDGYAPNERFYFPGEVTEETNPNRQFEGYSKFNTINVDSFLYDNDEMNEMFGSGIISEFYCEKCCSSSHIKPMNIISHSFSLDELSFIFSRQCINKNAWIRNRLLEKIKISLGMANPSVRDKQDDKLLSKKNMRENGLVVMDVGSRLGSILYYCYLFVDPLSVKQLIGVEINEFFANLQKETVKANKMDDRITILNSDIMKEMDLIQTCDILIMHNVFEWFFSHKENQDIWKILKEKFLIRKGLRIVTCPSIQQSLLDAGLSNTLSIDGWLKEIPLTYPLDENDEEMHTEIHLYEVL